MVDVRTSERLAAAALKIFVSTNDFTALHGVTGLEALSQLRPYVHDVARFDHSSFQALAAAYLSIGAPNVWSGHRLQDLVMSEELDMLSVARCAANSDDAHVAKFVYSALRLGRTTGYPLYFVVAHRAVERRDPGSHRGSTMHRVTSEIGEVSPYFYPNKRIVLWGRRG